jgi:internalin A
MVKIDIKKCYPYNENHFFLKAVYSGFATIYYQNMSNPYSENLSRLKNIFYLKVLVLLKNDFKDISFIKDFNNIKTLILNTNQITDISPLGYLNECLTELALCGNQKLMDISPLKGMKNLEQLNLSNTSIHDLSPLVGMKNLTILDLSYCQVQIGDLYHLMNTINLKRLNIHSSKILPEQIIELQKSFPECKIIY